MAVAEAAVVGVAAVVAAVVAVAPDNFAALHGAKADAVAVAIAALMGVAAVKDAVVVVAAGGGAVPVRTDRGALGLCRGGGLRSRGRGRGGLVLLGAVPAAPSVMPAAMAAAVGVSRHSGYGQQNGREEEREDLFVAHGKNSFPIHINR